MSTSLTTEGQRQLQSHFRPYRAQQKEELDGSLNRLSSAWKLRARQAMITRFTRWLLAGSLALSLFSSRISGLSAAEAEVLFEDDFSELDASFSQTDHTKISVENKNLVIDSQPGWGYSAFYQSAVFDNADISVQVRLTNPDAEKGTYAGIAFWAASYSEYTLFAISDSGTTGVLSTNGTRTYYPAPWRKSDALKTDGDEWNVLRVVTVGNWATVYLNGKKIASFKGKPPQGGSLIGPFFSAGNDEPASGRFSMLKVVTPTGSDAAVPEEKKSDPDIIFSDDFSVLDPGWGVESGQLSVKDKKLLIKPQLEHGYHVFCQATLVEDIDMSVKARVSDNDPSSGCAAGIVFWAVKFDDFFIFEVNDQGQVAVFRLLKGRWLNPLPSKAPPAEAKFRPDSANELRVVTNGRKATCYVNGVSVGSITGQSIKGEWQFGMYAETGKGQAVAEYSSLVVRKPGRPAGVKVSDLRPGLRESKIASPQTGPTIRAVTLPLRGSPASRSSEARLPGTLPAARVAATTVQRSESAARMTDRAAAADSKNTASIAPTPMTQRRQNRPDSQASEDVTRTRASYVPASSSVASRGAAPEQRQEMTSLKPGSLISPITPTTQPAAGTKSR